jgi:dephospho-CoA kinase
MYIVGLTGGIGSGKSTIAHFFKELGVPVYDSDAEAKALMHDSVSLRSALKEEFGEEVYSGESLNKTWLAQRVFSDGKALEKLNSLVHPAVREHFLNWAKSQDYPYVIQETALIFENEAADRYSETLLVVAPEDIRVQRVIRRNGWTEAGVRERMNAQLSDQVKRELADAVIENLDLELSRSRVEQLHRYYLQQATKSR